MCSPCRLSRYLQILYLKSWIPLFFFHGIICKCCVTSFLLVTTISVSFIEQSWIHRQRLQKLLKGKNAVRGDVLYAFWAESSVSKNNKNFSDVWYCYLDGIFAFLTLFNYPWNCEVTVNFCLSQVDYIWHCNCVFNSNCVLLGENWSLNMNSEDMK